MDAMSLISLKEKKVSSVILDLRNNGGGALDDARMISGLFIKKGPIVQVKAQTGAVEILADRDSSVVFDGEVVVLLNRFSASASEIVAAALQDYERAVVIGGEFSHGKGTVQTLVSLDDYIPAMAKSYSPFGSLKVTIQKFYRVNGSSTQYKGVTPDIVLPDPYAYMETGERYLDYSLPWSQVNAVDFSKWTPKKYSLKKVIENSKSRVSKEPRFQKMQEAISWYQKRKDETQKKLSLQDFLKDKKEIEEKSEKLKIEEETQNLQVLPLKALVEEDEKEKFEDFRKDLRKDPYIDEALFVLTEMRS